MDFKNKLLVVLDKEKAAIYTFNSEIPGNISPETRIEGEKFEFDKAYKIALDKENGHIIVYFQGYSKRYLIEAHSVSKNPKKSDSQQFLPTQE